MEERVKRNRVQRGVRFDYEHSGPVLLAALRDHQVVVEGVKVGTIRPLVGVLNERFGLSDTAEVWVGRCRYARDIEAIQQDADYPRYHHVTQVLRAAYHRSGHTTDSLAVALNMPNSRVSMLLGERIRWTQEWIDVIAQELGVVPVPRLDDSACDEGVEAAVDSEDPSQWGIQLRLPDPPVGMDGALADLRRGMEAAMRVMQEHDAITARLEAMTAERDALLRWRNEMIQRLQGLPAI
jgi:hypothetical protein